IPAYYDDDDGYNFAITPHETVESLIMGDEHLDTIPATKSDEFIKSSFENLVPNPSESEGENGCDMLACFTTFSNILFDVEYEFDSVDNQSLHNEEFPEEIFLNPLFEEEINSMMICQHHFNVKKERVKFSVGDHVLLKVSPWKGMVRLGKKGKLVPRFVGPFEITKRISPVTYRLRLPKELNDVHDTFHVSNLKKCLADQTLHVLLEEIQIDAKLNFMEEPVKILEREFKKLKRSMIPIIKFRWNSKRGPEFT
nr:putative reverse transcriptase domain-containing protein [Tanacetum cinerariifolium]